jgi:hypothetical protein
VEARTAPRRVVVRVRYVGPRKGIDWSSPLIAWLSGKAADSSMGSYITLAIVSIVALFILALVALVRCRPEDIPKIVEALARWWRK